MTAMDEISAVSRVATFTVATDRYLPFWCDLVQGIDQFLFPTADVEIHVFTDRPDEALEMQGNLSARCTIVIHAIPRLGWPEATLLRYELIEGALPQVEADICLHLDADLKFVAVVGPELRPGAWTGGLALVAHPGYWRDRMPRSLADLRHRVAGRRHSLWGGPGTWETRTESNAHVPRQHRKTYVCGGVWMGRKAEFDRMVRELAQRTRDDMTRGITARWHDESHLNWYASQTTVTVLPPAYCAVPDYPWLANITPRIVAVEKGDWERQP